MSWAPYYWPSIHASKLSRPLLDCAEAYSSSIISLKRIINYPLSLRSWLLGQPLLIPPMYRRIIQQTWYCLLLFSLLRTQRLRHKILLERMRRRQSILLSQMRHRSPDAGEGKAVHCLRIRGSCGCCGYIARRYSRLKLPN